MRALIRGGVDKADPPYGYILAAATNISKATYDVFREELRQKGVKELYFWGKDHLEDQLALPQHDEILFTFFGLSLSPRRRSKVAELKFAINNKNKILKLLYGSEPLIGVGMPRGQSFLLRDIKADEYPWKQQYPDFDTRRRWEEHEVAQVMPDGLSFKIRERYAYYDAATTQWDESTAIDLIHRKHDLDESNAARFTDHGKHAEYFWQHLPRRVQAKLMVHGFVRFDQMLIIDEKGDPEYTNPHIFIDFSPHGPWHGTNANIIRRGHAIYNFEDGPRLEVFPLTFPVPPAGTVLDLDTLGLSKEALKWFGYARGSTTLYLFHNELDEVLVVGNILRVPREDHKSDNHFEVTHIYKTTVGAIITEQGEFQRQTLERHAGRPVTDLDLVARLRVTISNRATS
jgi:hypothetical protein